MDNLRWGTKEYFSKWRNDNRQHLLEYKRNWRKKNKDHDNVVNKENFEKKWMKDGGVLYRQSRRSLSQRRREEVIILMGGECAHCGYRKDVRALQIDHVKGGGSKDRKTFGHSASTLLRKCMQSIEKKDGKFQVLCANCNWIKRYENRELNRKDKA